MMFLQTTLCLDEDNYKRGKLCMFDFQCPRATSCDKFNKCSKQKAKETDCNICEDKDKPEPPTATKTAEPNTTKTTKTETKTTTKRTDLTRTTKRTEPTTTTKRTEPATTTKRTVPTTSKKRTEPTTTKKTSEPTTTTKKTEPTTTTARTEPTTTKKNRADNHRNGNQNDNNYRQSNKKKKKMEGSVSGESPVAFRTECFFSLKMVKENCLGHFFIAGEPFVYQPYQLSYQWCFV